METLARTPEHIGIALRRARKARRWTQTDVRARSGLRVATISSVENEDVGTQWGDHVLDLSRFCAAPGARLSHLSLPAGVPCAPPDQLCLDGFEERFNGGVVIAISLAAHGDPEAVLARVFLVVMRAVWASTISMMDAALGWRAECNSHVQSTDRKIAFHPITNSPADHAPGMQIQDHSQIKPAFTRPDVGYVTHPLLV